MPRVIGSSVYWVQLSDSSLTEALLTLPGTRDSGQEDGRIEIRVSVWDTDTEGTETVRLEVGTMASPAFSSDEGEIVEATPLPRAERNGDVDRTARHRARLPSRTPDDDLPSRAPVDGVRRRSRSPRGWKRPRDDPRDHRDRRDTRQFHVHYEGNPREDRRQYRDLDRPVSRGSDRYDGRPNTDHASHEPPSRAAPAHRGNARNGIGYDRSHDRDRGQDGYPDKRARTRSRSPRGRFDKGRRDRGRNGAGLVPNEDKYSAQAERRSQDGSFSRRDPPGGAPYSSKRDAKTDKGATVERGIDGLAISQTR